MAQTTTTLREYLQITEDAINSDRVNEAFANCQYVLTHFPELLEGRRLLGEIYLKQGRLEEAQQTFDWVLTNDPENVVAYCSRALISEQLKDYDTALDCYQQAYELSRGISHIRQEFNQLSEKVGQPGFIFSRAGLARLYMRGDLLPQAIQEWESVLAATPDRLDARTGLLETYWREGLYDRVEQLAKQILNEVPHCSKALVLLAHVTFAQNALQAQELIQQAKALDRHQQFFLRKSKQSQNLPNQQICYPRRQMVMVQLRHPLSLIPSYAGAAWITLLSLNRNTRRYKIYRPLEAGPAILQANSAHGICMVMVKARMHWDNTEYKQKQNI